MYANAGINSPNEARLGVQFQKLAPGNLSMPVSCLKSISIFMRALTRLVRYFPSSAQRTVETYQSCIDLGVDIYKLALALQ
jgi:hypothetical protein